MKNVSPTVSDLAYAAGFFDGEGHIRITKHSKRCNCYHLQTSAVQATPYPLDLFKELFGGTMKSSIVKYKDELKARYTWQVSSLQAEHFLTSVLPYLIVKKDEAIVALEFRAKKRDQTKFGGRKKLTSDEVAFRKEKSEKLVSMRKYKRQKALDEAKQIKENEKCVAYS